MIWYNLRLITRRIAKDKVFTMVNICGLTLGIASFLILLLHVTNEKSFDKHFNDSNDIYRIISTPEQSDEPWARSLGFIKEASSSFPEIEEATQFTHCPVANINIGDQDFQQKDVMSVDESFINMFSVKSAIGDLSEIAKPNTAFITEGFARKYYKNENPIGKTIDIKYLQGVSDDLPEFEIKGIIKNTAPKTHFNYQILLSQKGALEKSFARLWDRKTHWVYNYIKTKDKVPHTEIADKLLAYYNASSFKQTPGPKDYRFNLTPITDIHLKSNTRFELKESSSEVNIGLFIMISIVILLVSLLNYINLSTARLLKRSKEMGIKKSVGANKGQLIGQVLAEVAMLCSLSLILALVSIELLKPAINQFFEIEFSIYYSEPMVYSCIAGILVACVGFSGIIISFFLLRKTSAIDLLSKKTSFSGIPGIKSLLIAQVTVVIVLISATFLVNKQINFIFHKPLGYNKENVVVLELKDRTKDPDVFASELKKLSQVTSLGFTRQYFGYPTQSLSLEDLGIEGNVAITFANYDYLETMNIELAENWIDTSMSNINGMVINQHLYRRLMARHGSIEALEKHMSNREIANPNEPRINNIIGVAKDFNYNSAHEQIGDFAFVLNESGYNARFAHIRINSENVKNAMNNINAVWNNYYPNNNFNYFFIDERVAQQYKAETILSRILSIFSAIGILISIIGISALSLFISQQRTKEIGIRKINGAKLSEILGMLNKDFIKWVVIAFVIATPIDWYVMNKWLENFAYKTTLSWWIFALAGMLALGIVLLTVSFQSWKAATKNPVESLRYE